MTLSQLKAILTAPDKILHGKASVGVLVISIAILVVGYYVGLHPVSIMLLEAAWLAAASVEGTQWYSNRLAQKQDLPLPHEVSLLDAFFSQFATMLVVIGIELARYFHVLPSWFNVFTSDRLPVWLVS